MRFWDILIYQTCTGRKTTIKTNSLLLVWPKSIVVIDYGTLWFDYQIDSQIDIFLILFLYLFRLPFYYELKILFVLWLLSPATKGASYLYRKFVHPQLAKREKVILANSVLGRSRAYANSEPSVDEILPCIDLIDCRVQGYLVNRKPLPVYKQVLL